MNSMKIGTYQMDTTFGLYLPEYTIPAPAVQTNFVKIIGRDGSVDLSNALGLHYDSRTWSLDFKCFDPTVNWHTLSSQVMNAIHGKRLNFEFDDDPNYFWTGRVSVQNYVSNHGTGTLKVTIVSDPFKYAKLSTIVTKTASTGTEYTGSMVTFNDGLIYDLSADIEPIQDLHGYDSPWPAGGGKNKLNVFAYNQSEDENGITFTVNNDGSVTMNGTATLQSQIYWQIPADVAHGFADMLLDSFETAAVNGVFVILEESGGSYTIYAKNNTVEGSIISSSIASLTGGVNLIIRIAKGTTLNNFKVYPMIRPSSSSDGFAPYSNICPISGLTGLSVYRTGKNLLDKSKAKLYNNVARFIKFGVSAYSDTTPNGDLCLEAGTYTFSMSGDGTDNFVTFRVYNSSGTSIKTQYNAKTSTFTVSEKGAYIITLDLGDARDWNIYNNQLELGSTATAYEPYQGNTYAVDWTTQAGTVYGGTVDVVTGVLTVTMAIVDLGTLTWSKSDLKPERFYTPSTVSDIPYKFSNSCHMICSDYKYDGVGNTTIGSYYGQNGTFRYYYVSTAPTSTAREIYIVDEAKASLTASEFKSAMNGVKLVYELATPITYQLTAQEVEALVGTNNVWSDGGNVTVAVVTPETLTNNGRAVVPTLTASADMVLKWGNYSASVQQGTSTIPQLILENGANLVYIIGTGSISFTWQEVSL